MQSLGQLIRDHLAAGDTAARQAERIAIMAHSPRRAASVRQMAGEIHYDLGRMTREQAGLNRSKSRTPSMNVRRIGGLLYGGAHRWHCHAGVYRTYGAHSMLTCGGFAMEGNALVHCEHTIPASLMVDLMWRLRHEGAFPKPADLLAWLLRHSVVTVALQSERKANDDQWVSLGRRRTFDGVTRGWGYKHPDLLDDTAMTDMVRPFRRYLHTGVEVIYSPTGRKVDLGETMATHAARIAACPLHDISTYYPEDY